MKKKNYYEILGIKSDASEEEIKKAYHKLTRKYHPDSQSGKSIEEKKEIEKKMIEINEAYNSLKDKSKRKEYDELRRHGYDFQNGNDDNDFQFSWSNFSDDISSFFWGNNQKNNDNGYTKYSYENEQYEGGRYSKNQKGDDIVINFSLKFKESILGTKREMMIDLKKACYDCNQFGYESSSDVSICNECKGSGFISILIFGSLKTSTTCSRCFGSGKLIKKRCSACKGSLFIKKKEKIIFNIPKGIHPDRKLKYKGIGNDGIFSKEKGDIYVSLKIEKDNYYSRKDNDIHVNIPISFIDAIIGSKIKIFTIEGIEEIKIPSGTQNNDYIIINSRGCYNDIGINRRGDLYVWFQVKLPNKLSPNSQILLDKLYDDIKYSWNPNKEFIDKNKNIL